MQKGYVATCKESVFFMLFSIIFLVSKWLNGKKKLSLDFQFSLLFHHSTNIELNPLNKAVQNTESMHAISDKHP